jgi:ankyrin repeat protein
MTSADDDERCRQAAMFRRIDAAFRGGDFEGLREALNKPDGFPNVQGPITIGHCLEYAIYHSPLAFIRELLERGADPNYPDHAGFPSLIAALSCRQSAPGAPARPDSLAVVRLLLEKGASTAQRGVNDCTPLHWAVGARDEDAVRLLVEYGADSSARTRIDDYESAAELAERIGDVRILQALSAADGPRGA